MLLHRYANIDYIMEKNVIDGILFINEAIKQRKIDQIREQWLVQLPYMPKDEFVSFEDYKARFMCEAVTTKSNEEILKEARGIEQRLKGGE